MLSCDTVELMSWIGSIVAFSSVSHFVTWSFFFDYSTNCLRCKFECFGSQRVPFFKDPSLWQTALPIVFMNHKHGLCVCFGKKGCFLRSSNMAFQKAVRWSLCDLFTKIISSTISEQKDANKEMYKANWQKKCSYCDESINTISWSISKEYTAQLVLTDIYTLFSAHLFSSQKQSGAIPERPSRCSGLDSLIKI